MTTEEKIAEMRADLERETALQSAALTLYTRHSREAQRLEAEIAEVTGDDVRARWLRLLADEDADPGERQAAYIRVQARNVYRTPSAVEALDEKDRPAVLAEVERMRAEEKACPCGHPAKEHGHGGSGWCLVADAKPCPCVAFGESQGGERATQG